MGIWYNDIVFCTSEYFWNGKQYETISSAKHSEYSLHNDAFNAGISEWEISGMALMHSKEK